MKKIVVFFICMILLINLTLAFSITGSAFGDKNKGQINNDDEKEIPYGDDGLMACETYNYSNCPTGCVKKCFPKDCIKNGVVLADCECDETKGCLSHNKIKNLTKEQIKEVIKERNRIKFENKTGVECPDNCTCAGVTVKCETEDGREMTVYARSGNIIFQVKNVNASTQVTLYQHNKTIYAVFKNNETKKIILPDEVKERLEEKLKSKLENKNITLNKDGFYEIQMQKKARLFFLFKIKEKIQAEINAENGEIVKLKNPWWRFLAKDVSEDTNETAG